MFKQLSALIVISIAIVLFMTYAQQGVQFLVSAHDWVSQLLTEVFTGGQAGNIARGLIALLCVPFIAAFVPAIFYWFAKRNWFPYFMQIVWAVWLVQAGALVMVYKAVVVS